MKVDKLLRRRDRVIAGKESVMEPIPNGFVVKDKVLAFMAAKDRERRLVAQTERAVGFYPTDEGSSPSESTK